jgi:hypothetical protein
VIPARDDDSAAREQGPGTGRPSDTKREDALSAELSAYTGIEEFRLLQRHLATVDFSALQAAQHVARVASQSIDFAGLQAAQHIITKSVSQSINFSALQAAAALVHSDEINSLGQIGRAWADSLNKAIDVSALHKAYAAALASVDLTALGHAQQAAAAAVLRYQVDLSPLREVLSKAWRGIDWQQLRERRNLWIPLNLRDSRDLAAIAQLSLDEGLPLAWVPRSAIVDALLTSDTPQERALIFDERFTDILDDCEAVLVDIPHEWAKECLAAISALRVGFDGPAQSHAGNIIDSIVLRLLGRNGRDRAKARAGEPFDDVPLRLASESLTLRPLYRAFVTWWPARDARPPDHFARHATAHAVGHPGLFHQRHALVAVMLATSLTVQFWDDDVDGSPGAMSTLVTPDP